MSTAWKSLTDPIHYRDAQLESKGCDSSILERRIAAFDCLLRLFTDTEARENPPQQVIGAKRAGNLAKRMLSLTQVFRQ